MRKLEVLLDGLNFPEAPRWRGDRLWFSDLHAAKVMTVDLADRAETVVEVPGWLAQSRPGAGRCGALRHRPEGKRHRRDRAHR